MQIFIVVFLKTIIFFFKALTIKKIVYKDKKYEKRICEKYLEKNKVP